jgi:hypothetical protein
VQRRRHHQQGWSIRAATDGHADDGLWLAGGSAWNPRILVWKEYDCSWYNKFIIINLANPTAHHLRPRWKCSPKSPTVHLTGSSPDQRPNAGSHLAQMWMEGCPTLPNPFELYKPLKLQNFKIKVPRQCLKLTYDGVAWTTSDHNYYFISLPARLFWLLPLLMFIHVHVLGLLFPTWNSLPSFTAKTHRLISC